MTAKEEQAFEDVLLAYMDAAKMRRSMRPGFLYMVRLRFGAAVSIDAGILEQLATLCAVRQTVPVENLADPANTVLQIIEQNAWSLGHRYGIVNVLLRLQRGYELPQH